MGLTEKVMYLKGLIDGFEYDMTTKEGKILKAVMDILEDMALAVEDIDNTIDMMDERFDDIEDILDLEEEEGCGCHHHHHMEDEGEYYEVICPTCSEEIVIDEDMLDEGELFCPNCNEKLEFDLSGALEDLEDSEDISF